MASYMAVVGGCLNSHSLLALERGKDYPLFEKARHQNKGRQMTEDEFQRIMAANRRSRRMILIAQVTMLVAFLICVSIIITVRALNGAL